MKEIIFNELGYFTENAMKKLKNAMEGKTFMNFKISWSNLAGNCTLVVSTDYDETVEEIKNFFLASALTTLLTLR